MVTERLVKTAIIYNATYRFNVNSKRPLGRNTQAYPNIYTELQGTPKRQNNHMSLQSKSPVGKGKGA